MKTLEQTLQGRYTKAALFLKKEEEKKRARDFKKRCYSRFIHTWDAEVHGPMTERRFFSHFAHFHEADQYRVLIEKMDELHAAGVRAAPIVWKLYAKTPRHTKKSISTPRLF